MQSCCYIQCFTQQCGQSWFQLLKYFILLSQIGKWKVKVHPVKRTHSASPSSKHVLKAPGLGQPRQSDDWSEEIFIILILNENEIKTTHAPIKGWNFIWKVSTFFQGSQQRWLQIFPFFWPLFHLLSKHLWKRSEVIYTLSSYFVWNIFVSNYYIIIKFKTITIKL